MILGFQTVNIDGGFQITRSHPNLYEFGYNPKNCGIDELVRISCLWAMLQSSPATDKYCDSSPPFAGLGAVFS